MKARTLTLLAGLAGAFALLSRRTLAAGAAGGVLSLREVRALAEGTVAAFAFDVPADLVVRIAWIESHFNPSAIRYEAHIGDASAGLMQTLLGTAQWLARDMGYSAFGVPDLARLLEPQASLYFGAAYLDYLRTWRGQRRSDEWIVRHYNTGPGASDALGEPYWQKYLAAKKEIG